MGCIIHKSKKPKQKSPILTMDHDSSNTLKDNNENNMSSSEKIIVLKPLRYKNTCSTLNNNTYIHYRCSSKLIPCPVSNLVRGKTLVIKDDNKGVDGLNISQHQKNKNNFNTQLLQKLNIEQ